MPETIKVWEKFVDISWLLINCEAAVLIPPRANLKNKPFNGKLMNKLLEVVTGREIKEIRLCSESTLPRKTTQSTWKGYLVAKNSAFINLYMIKD